MAVRPLSFEQVPESAPSEYAFKRGFPTSETIQRAYDDADLSRATEAYRFFYPTVSGSAIFKGNEKIGIVPNQVFGTLDTKPMHVGFTLNSDTPYAPLLMDLSDGPLVVELPPGPLICIAMDVNQLWVADLGLPGPAAGKGDKVVFLPPGYKDQPPAGYRVANSPRTRCSSAFDPFLSMATLPELSNASRPRRSIPSSPRPAGLKPNGSTSRRSRKTLRRSLGRVIFNTGANSTKSSTPNHPTPISTTCTVSSQR